jgi:hypothetical protein
MKARNLKLNTHESFLKIWQFTNIFESIQTGNSLHKEIKSRLILRNACYYSVQNPFPWEIE